jgi:hypothetical protein
MITSWLYRSIKGQSREISSLRTEKKLGKYKLNVFVFIRDVGKCERFAFRFVPKKCKRNWRTLIPSHPYSCSPRAQKNSNDPTLPAEYFSIKKNALLAIGIRKGKTTVCPGKQQLIFSLYC